MIFKENVNSLFYETIKLKRLKNIVFSLIVKKLIFLNKDFYVTYKIFLLLDIKLLDINNLFSWVYFYYKSLLLG